MDKIKVSMEQKFDRSVMIQAQKDLLKEVTADGMLETSEGSQIFARLRQLQMAVESCMKQDVVFELIVPEVPEQDSRTEELKKFRQYFGQLYNQLGDAIKEFRAELKPILKEVVRKRHKSVSERFSLAQQKLHKGMIFEDYIYERFKKRIELRKPFQIARLRELKSIKTQLELKIQERDLWRKKYEQLLQNNPSNEDESDSQEETVQIQ